jgi:2-oxoglutarate ferredoxin oxidoreductase subunit beta
MNAVLSARDFATDQEVRWCPGCGDYAILRCVQKALADAGASPHQTVFVSGIGCSSRFPYYMNTYGFHGIHGRAPAIATGLKLTNPDLAVWVITGDGDGLSIGGNHLLHALRRNIGLKILLFNNSIYGLTKGQYSPTSSTGTRTPSSPDGSIDQPLSPCSFALGSGARFIARGIDTDKTHLGHVMRETNNYPGAAFVEIFQNCPVYNDNVFAAFTGRENTSEAQLHVKHGEPLLFGKNNDKGLRLNTGTLSLEIVNVSGDNGHDSVMIHDETNKVLAQMLIEMHAPEFPIALGVIYRSQGAVYEAAFSTRPPPKPGASDGIDQWMQKTRLWKVE